MIKRIFDVAVAAPVLLLLSPILLVLAIAVRHDGGPAFFRQERIGRGGRPFLIRKFRTMREQEEGPVGRHSPALDEPAVTTDHDPRITRVGRLLRATKLDELPQLLDVLAGTMSLVGPRPEVQKYVECWPMEARERVLSVRPGITDPASIVYRRESEELARATDPESYYVDVVLPRKIEMYLVYVSTRTFVGDLAILARTVHAVITG